MFESSGFRRMVAPHLPIKPGGKALGLARDDDDEGWEAMAMRDELTDIMLHNAFGDAILKEVGARVWPGVTCVCLPVLSGHNSLRYGDSLVTRTVVLMTSRARPVFFFFLLV